MDPNDLPWKIMEKQTTDHNGYGHLLTIDPGTFQGK